MTTSASLQFTSNNPTASPISGCTAPVKTGMNPNVQAPGTTPASSTNPTQSTTPANCTNPTSGTTSSNKTVHTWCSINQLRFRIIIHCFLPFKIVFLNKVVFTSLIFLYNELNKPISHDYYLLPVNSHHLKNEDYLILKILRAKKCVMPK